MRKFDLFDHESDIGVEVSADTLEELFAGAAEALYSLIARKKNIKKSVLLEIEVSGDSLEELLVNWLNELIFRFEADELYCAGFNVKISGGDNAMKFLKAGINTEKIDWQKDEILHEVKAATYHQLKIGKKDGKYQVRIIFDL